MPCFGQKLLIFHYLWSIFWYHLVSNMQISRFNLIIYNSCNWAASFTLISPVAITFFSYLACSSVVRLSYCISPSCCSHGALCGFMLDTYDGTERGSTNGSFEITTGGNLEGLLLRDWLVSLDGLDIVTNFGNELGISDGKVLVRALRSLFGI